MKHYLKLLCLLLPFIATAQQRSCLSEQHTDKLNIRSSYQFKTAFLDRNNNLFSCDSLIVPVAFHFQGTSADRECLSDFVEQQLKIINDDFAGTNADRQNFEKWKANYPNLNLGASCIKFKIANHNHPQGYGLQDSMKAITINKLVDEDWNADWSNYLNIFVKQVDDANLILGYSPLGGSGRGDGVVIAKYAFGGRGWCSDIGQNNNFDKGRTLTHELGHFFGLEHIWGNQQNCEEDDGIRDTPNQSTPNYGCIRNRISCSSVDLSMNFMDYVDDGCMYLFTHNQVRRMDAYVQTFLPHLVVNAYKVVKELEAVEIPEEIMTEPPLDTLAELPKDTIINDPGTDDDLPVIPTDKTPTMWILIGIIALTFGYSIINLIRGKNNAALGLFICFAVLACKKEQLKISEPILKGSWKINTDAKFFHIQRLDIYDTEIRFHYDTNEDGEIESVIENDYYSKQSGDIATLWVKWDDEYKPFATYFLHHNNRYLYLNKAGFKEIIFERINE